MVDSQRTYGAIKGSIGERDRVSTRVHPRNGPGLLRRLVEHDLGNIEGAPFPALTTEGNGVVACSTSQVEVAAEGSQAQLSSECLCNGWISAPRSRVGTADRVI